MLAATTLVGSLVPTLPAVAGVNVGGNTLIADVVAENVTHVTNVPGSTGGHASVEGDRLYVGAYGTGMRIFDIANPADPQVLGDWRPGPQDTGDLGARADAVPDATVMDGRHIVALGGTSRARGTQQTEFIDATDPENLELLHRSTGPEDGEAHNSDIFDRERLWLPSGGRGDFGFRIFDLEPLLAGEAPTRLLNRNPVTMWEQSPVRERLGRDVGADFTHTHDLTIYPDHEILLQPDQWVDQDGDGDLDPTRGERDIVVLAEGGSYTNDNGNTGSIFIIDITDPTAPVVLNRWVKGTDADADDGHPIRYYHEVQLLEADPSVMFVSDEDLHNGCEAGGISTVRLSEDLTKATWMADWFNGPGTPAAVCSVHVFSTRGHYVFIGSYNAGLQVLDLSDPANPVRAGQFIAPGANSWGATVHGDHIYVGDFGVRGLDVFRFEPPAAAPSSFLRYL